MNWSSRLCVAALLTLVVGKAVAQPTVDVTRTGGANWVCEDPYGTVLSNHTGLDQAQEACTNRALADPGATYTIRSGAYRIVATVPSAPTPTPEPEPTPEPTPEPVENWVGCTTFEAVNYQCVERRTTFDGYTEQLGTNGQWWYFPIADTEPTPDPIPTPDPTPLPEPSGSFAEQFPGIPEPWGYDLVPSGPESAYSTTIGAGQVVANDATRGAQNFTCNGTASNPGFLVNRGNFTGMVTIRGSYCVFVGGTYSGRDGALRYGSEGVPTSFVVVKDARIIDDDNGNGAAVAGAGSNFVLMDSVLGPSQQLSWIGQDHHCFKLAGSDIWVIRVRFELCLGDGIQVGDQNNQPGQINRVYIVGNYFRANNQTGAWVKNATDVIIAYNMMRDHTSGGDSVAACGGAQYSHSYLWFIANDCDGGPVGFRIASTDGGTWRLFADNIAHVTRQAGTDPFQTGFALQSWSSSPVYAFGNTADSLASARAAVQGCNNTISGRVINLTQNCDMGPARSLYQQRVGLPAPF